ncbi:hypothetical protein [Tardiphaga sp.]|uniref:hypothetical protein n=1 Tax=Tardiphaga sp. TaxID=1926292 RepID=UPI0026205568|nr:hypothetical protein [Tardiphaga sp.]MDB5616276.1 hypothetical protein [Tardiphaga sp.]
MTMTALQPAEYDRDEPGSAEALPSASVAELLAANINPRTGLATDYLNHFNEAIMLLELIPDMPDCFELFLEWQPLSYAEHFIKSNFRARDLAIASYESANHILRSEFDAVVATMTSILTAVGEAMRSVHQDKTRATLAEQAANWVKPLVGVAGGIINGRDQESNVDDIMSYAAP